VNGNLVTHIDGVVVVVVKSNIAAAAAADDDDDVSSYVVKDCNRGNGDGRC
jgi:hypothetical protein